MVDLCRSFKINLTAHYQNVSFNLISFAEMLNDNGEKDLTNTCLEF